MHAFNPSIWEVKAGEFLVSQDNHGYKEIAYHKKPRDKTKQSNKQKIKQINKKQTNKTQVK